MHRFKRPSAATIIAFVALFVAVGGGTAMAAKLITGKQIKNGSVTGTDIKNRSISRSDLGFSTGGGKDGAGHILHIESPKLHLNPGESVVDADPNNNWDAHCPGGYTVVGTGFNGGIGQTGFVEAFGSFVGAYMYNDTSIDYDVTVQAICAKATGVTEASARDERAAYTRARIAFDNRRASHVTATAAKSCSGYVRARINGVIKCLRRGQYCAHAYDHRAPHPYSYKHYGFACRTRDSYGSYHLTYR